MTGEADCGIIWIREVEIWISERMRLKTKQYKLERLRTGNKLGKAEWWIIWIREDET
jgi:hypothetical protein